MIGEDQQANSSGVLLIKQTIGVDRTDTAINIKYHNWNCTHCSYPPPYFDSLFMLETLRLQRVDVYPVQFGHDKELRSMLVC